MALEGEKEGVPAPEHPGEDPVLLKIEDEFSIYSIRKAALQRADQIGMAGAELNELEIIVRELVTNVLTHGGQAGHMVLSHVNDEEGTTLALDVVDRGPGFQDFGQALEDGFSTSGTLGGGLPSVQRFAERVELLHTGPGGSHLRVTKRVQINPLESQRQWSFSLFSRPHPEEAECGDQGTLIRHREGILLVLADGLGHGSSAALAARQAVDIAHMSHRLPLEELVRTMHRRLRKTRGTAVSLARIRPEANLLEWIGIGNVSGRIVRPGNGFSPQHIAFANFNGTVGAQISHFRLLRYEYEPGDWLMLHTDGLTRHWNVHLEQNLEKPPLTVGKLILQQATRRNDDAALLLGRVRQ